MRTSKKLIIGAVAVAAVVASAHGYPYAYVTTKEGVEEKISLSELFERNVDRAYSSWAELGYRQNISGGGSKGRRARKHKHVHLPAFLRMVTELDLRGNSLTNFVVPPGMVQLRRIRLAGNTQLTNLVIQQDTGVFLKELMDNRQDGQIPQEVSTSGRYSGGAGIIIRISFSDEANGGVDEETIAPLKTISAPEWLNGHIHYENITWKRLFAIKQDWRPSGVELVRWDGDLIACWGPGVLQDSYGLSGEWYDVLPNEVERERPEKRRFKIAHRYWGPPVITIMNIPLHLFRVRSTTGEYVSKGDLEPLEWKGDAYRRPFRSPIQEVTITQP